MTPTQPPLLPEAIDARPPHPMRAPCPACGATDGRIIWKAGQACVFCLGCNTWCYNAPGAEAPIPAAPDLAAEQRWLLDAEQALEQLGTGDPRYAGGVTLWQQRLHAYAVNVERFGEPDE